MNLLNLHTLQAQIARALAEPGVLYALPIVAVGVCILLEERGVPALRRLILRVIGPVPDPTTEARLVWKGRKKR